MENSILKKIGSVDVKITPDLCSYALILLIYTISLYSYTFFYINKNLSFSLFWTKNIV